MTVLSNAQPGTVRTPVAGPTGTPGLVASTDYPGFALINGTANIVSWTAPNDSNMHRVFIVGFQNVGSAETGGTVIASMTGPDGVARSPQIFAGSQGAGLHNPGFASLLIAPGSTITIQQSTALTAGNAICWLELWAS